MTTIPFIASRVARACEAEIKRMSARQNTAQLALLDRLHQLLTASKLAAEFGVDSIGNSAVINLSLEDLLLIEKSLPEPPLINTL